MTPVALAAELAATRERIADLEHVVEVLEVCVANYQDAWSQLREAS